MERTYGSLRYDSGRWVIECEPHVQIRLKRLFRRINESGKKSWLLSTDEICRDLQWFLFRYPMQISDRDLALLHDRSLAHQDRMSLVDELLSSRQAPPEFKLALPLRDYQRVAVELALQMRGLLISDDVGCGKQQPVDTNILTPSGYRPIGDLVVGDRVIGSNGKAVTVTGVFPQGVKPSYRVKFADGSSVETGPDHLWAVEYHIGGRHLHRIVVSTEQLRTGATVTTKWPNGVTGHLSLSKTPVLLPMLSGPAHFDPRGRLSLPSYLMGQIIANGSLASPSPSFTVCSSDWPEISARLIRDGVTIGNVHRYGNATRAGLPGLVPKLSAMGIRVLSGAKRIPAEYLLASVKDRIALLQGLMDGDGSCSDGRNRVTYSTTSAGLAEDVRNLAECLGGRVTVHSQDRRHSGRTIEYNLHIRLPSSIEPFSTMRKASRLLPGRREPTRGFVGVEYVRDVESVCIRVDAEDQLYVTEHAILTHNTACAIGTFTCPDTLPALVVTLPHLCLQWEREINRFAPTLRTHVVKKGSPYDLSATGRGGKKLPGDRFPDVVIMNYHKLHGWAGTLSDLVRSVTFDEIQELRRTESDKYAAAKMISDACQYRTGLSATPIMNYGSEFWAVIECLRPDALGTKGEFVREWCTEFGRNVKLRDPEAFGSYLREQGIMIRRTRADVGRELPSLQQIPMTIGADLKAIEKVSANVAELAKIILTQGGKGFDKMRATEELDMRMRQITGVAKSPFVAEFVKLLIESGEKVVVFAYHREVYSILLDKLKDHHPVMYTGSETTKQKEASVKAFIEGDAQAILISLRAGAGLDGLQKVCRTTVHGELDWSPGVMHQNIGRVFRDGQTQPVTAYCLIAEAGSDPIVADVLGIKHRQLEPVLNPNADLIEKLDVRNDNIRRLAENILRKQGIAIPSQEPLQSAPRI